MELIVGDPCWWYSLPEQGCGVKLGVPAVVARLSHSQILRRVWGAEAAPGQARGQSVGQVRAPRCLRSAVVTRLELRRSDWQGQLWLSWILAPLWQRLGGTEEVPGLQGPGWTWMPLPAGAEQSPEGWKLWKQRSLGRTDTLRESSCQRHPWIFITCFCLWDPFFLWKGRHNTWEIRYLEPCPDEQCMNTLGRVWALLWSLNQQPRTIWQSLVTESWMLKPRLKLW